MDISLSVCQCATTRSETTIRDEDDVASDREKRGARRRASEDDDDDDDDGDAIRVRHRAGTGGVPRPPRVNRSSGWLGFRPFAANDRRRVDRTATDGDGPGDGCAVATEGERRRVTDDAMRAFGSIRVGSSGDDAMGERGRGSSVLGGGRRSGEDGGLGLGRG